MIGKHFAGPLLALSLALLTIVLSGNGQVSACKCLPPKELAYCRMDYLALIQVRGKFWSLCFRLLKWFPPPTVDVINVDQSLRYYRFRMIRDLTPERSHNQTRILVNELSTSGSSASCGVVLDVNGTYLIGGHFQVNTNNVPLPTVHTCGGYVESWPATRPVTDLQAYVERCKQFDLTFNGTNY